MACAVSDFLNAYVQFSTLTVFFLPISSLQYQFANFKNDGYNNTGKGYLKLQLINQREDFSFALFSGGLSKVILKKDSIILIPSFMFSI
jgi:hypothetical protein